MSRTLPNHPASKLSLYVLLLLPTVVLPVVPPNAADDVLLFDGVGDLDWLLVGDDDGDWLLVGDDDGDWLLAGGLLVVVLPWLVVGDTDRLVVGVGDFDADEGALVVGTTLMPWVGGAWLLVGCVVVACELD